MAYQRFSNSHNEKIDLIQMLDHGSKYIKGNNIRPGSFNETQDFL